VNTRPGSLDSASSSSYYLAESSTGWLSTGTSRPGTSIVTGPDRVASSRRPALADAARARLQAPLAAATESELPLASAVTARMLAYVSARLARTAD
jgi:hypothetical protein